MHGVVQFTFVLGLFIKLQKALLASTNLSVHMEMLGSKWMRFYEMLYLSIFRNFVKKTEVSLKSDKNNRYFTWRHINLWYLMELFLECEMFWTNVVEKIKTHILSSVTFFQKSCHLWDVEKYGRVREATNYDVIWHVHVLCMLDNQGYRHTLWIWNTAFPWQ
jgi:hypothetical protein